jgi:hypothetical protein
MAMKANEVPSRPGGEARNFIEGPLRVGADNEIVAQTFHAGRFAMREFSHGAVIKDIKHAVP